MANEKDIYYKFQESRAITGDRSALLARLPNTDKYSLFLPVAELPPFEGSTDSVEYELINMPSVGQLEGKTRLENVEVPFMWHRDNIYRLEKYKGQVIDFLDFQPDFMAKKIKGTYTFRRDTAQPSTVLQGILTIVPMSMGDTTILNCRDMVEETLCFAETIPVTVEVGDSIDLSLAQSGVTATYAVAKIDDMTGEETADTTSFDITGSKATVKETASGLYAIKATATGYASWTTTVYVKGGATTFRL